MNNCTHRRISLLKNYPVCMDCKSEFKNGELAKFRNQRMVKCSHEKLQHGYASNPPQSKCLDCGEFFTKRDLTAIKPYADEIKRLRKALEFYASEKTYETDLTNQWEPVTLIDSDNGKRARQALEGDKQ